MMYRIVKAAWNVKISIVCMIGGVSIADSLFHTEYIKAALLIVILATLVKLQFILRDDLLSTIKRVHNENR